MLRRCFCKIIKGIEFLLLLFFITMVLVLLIPRIFQISQHVVLSGSMEPAIPTGSLCYLSHGVGVEDIRKGQIIGFQRADGTLVVHRITKIEDGLLYTKGDANDQEDIAPVQKENYFGKVVYVIPYLGYMMVFLQKKNVVMAIGMMAAAFFLLEVFGVSKRGGDRDEER